MTKKKPSLPTTPDPSHSLSELIKGLQYSVNCAQEMVATQHVELLNQYFDSNGKALTQKITTASGEEFDIPLISLVPHNSLLIDEIEIKFATKIQKGVNLDLNNDMANSVRHMDFSVDLTPVNDKGLMDISIKFKAKETPEAIARIIDECTKTIV